MKLEDFSGKGMDPRQRRYDAMHAEDFKEGIAEEIAKRFGTATVPCCRTIA